MTYQEMPGFTAPLSLQPNLPNVVAMQVICDTGQGNEIFQPMAQEGLVSYKLKGSFAEI